MAIVKKPIKKVPKAQPGAFIRKIAKAAEEKIVPKSFKLDENIAKEVVKKNEREALKEKMRGWDKRMDKKKAGGTMKKAQNGTKVGGPTYVNLKIKNPKAKDSADYKKGYDAVKSGKKTYFPNRATSEGINEGLGRLNKGVKAKAKTGTSLGMKSVKAGFDKNPGVTRADIITAAKGKAQNGKKLIKSGVKGMSENEKLKKGITRLAPVNKTMKSGGKMTKCKYGCN